MPYPFAPVSALAAEFLQVIAATKEVEPNYSTMEGFVAAKVFVEALERSAAKPDRESLIAGLEGLHDADLGGFFVDFNAKKHTGSAYVDMTILTQDGKVRR